MEPRLPYALNGPASFGTRQNRPNGYTEVAGGMPLKQYPMTQGSEFSRARRGYVAEKKWDWDGPKPGPCTRGSITGGGLRGAPRRRQQMCVRNRPMVQASAYKAKATLLAQTSGGEYAARRRMRAIGQSSTGQQRLSDGTWANQRMSFRSVDQNTVNRHRQRARSGGCTAPRKKGVPTRSCCTRPGPRVAGGPAHGGCCKLQGSRQTYQ